MEYKTPALKTTKGLVACSPIKKTEAAPVRVQGGFALAGKKADLIELELVAYSPDLEENIGRRVFISSERENQPWAKKVLSLDGQDFILIPANEIVMVRGS